MNDIEKAVLAKVNNVLGALKLKYAIIDSDGNQHGDLKVVQPKKRIASVYGYGVMRKYLKPYFANFPSNTTKQIPAGQYDAEVVRRSVCNMAGKQFGKDAYKTSVTKDKKHIIVTHLDTAVSSFLKKDPLQELLDDWK